METDLREQIMVALERAGNAADTTDDFKWNCHRALPGLADECIRQMRWVARETRVMWADNEGGHPDHCDCDVREYGSHVSYCWKIKPMTVAPDDWKPLND